MPILTVTDNAQLQNGVGGVYIVSSKSHPDIVRIGAGGINGGVRGLSARLQSLTGQGPRQCTCETHIYQPFKVVRVWPLKDWMPRRLIDAEICLYRAFLVRFPRHQGGLPDRSLFRVTTQPDWQTIFDQVSDDLAALEEIGVN